LKEVWAKGNREADIPVFVAREKRKHSKRKHFGGCHAEEEKGLPQQRREIIEVSPSSRIREQMNGEGGYP